MSESSFVPPDQPVLSTTSRNRTFCLPDLVSDRLDDVVEKVRQEGYTASRAEVVGALISLTSADPEHLHALMKRYRALTAREVPLAAQGENIEVRPIRPGPRAGR